METKYGGLITNRLTGLDFVFEAGLMSMFDCSWIEISMRLLLEIEVCLFFQVVKVCKCYGFG